MVWLYCEVRAGSALFYQNSPLGSGIALRQVRVRLGSWLLGKESPWRLGFRFLVFVLWWSFGEIFFLLLVGK